jgi:methionyl-tRNA formyltransferase
VKVAILTTDTPHHAYFVNQLLSLGHDVTVFCETNSSVKVPFETQHSFETRRDEYEWSRWFKGQRISMSQLARSFDVGSMNEASAIEQLAKSRTDVIVVFGTGLLRPPVIAVNEQGIFNLHGGDPEEYRGLDTHLWAIFHRDFGGLVTTLHRLDTGLDTGQIVSQGLIQLTRNMALHELRAANTELCVQLAADALRSLERDGEVASRPQRKKGRYYSAMPAVLKTVCAERFEAHVRKLDVA